MTTTVSAIADRLAKAAESGARPRHPYADTPHPHPENDGRDGPPPPPDPFRAIVRDEDYPAIEQPIEWMVRPLMLGPGRLALLVGSGGVGKTHVIQTVNVALVNGVETLGGLVPAGEPRRCLHIDTDQGLIATRRRYRRHAVGLRVTRRPALLALRDVTRDDPSFAPTDGAKWRELLRRYDFVVVDALAGLLSAYGLDENKASDVRRVLDPMTDASDATRCTVVMVAHTGHDVRGDDGTKKQQTNPRGSSAIVQAGGVQWSFTGEAERGAVRTARRMRDAADDDGDDDIVSRFSYRIEATEDEVPGMRRRDGGPIYGLRVVRVETQGRARTKRDEAELTTDILRAIARGGLRSQNDVERRVEGHNAKTIRDEYKRLVSDQSILTGLRGELIVAPDVLASLPPEEVRP